MGLLARNTWARGWCPDCDANNAPTDVALRLDNLVLDERGVLSLRKGSTLLSTGGGDAHSLWTGYLSGTRYRMVGSGSTIYANGGSIATAVAGSDDVQFGSYLGQIFFARSTTKKKYDGTTVRNWGIAMTGGVPTVAAVTSDSKALATGAAGEVTWTFEATSSAPAAGNAANHAGTGASAIEIEPDAFGAVVATRILAADTDFTTLTGGTVADDEAIVSFYVLLDDPASVTDVSLFVGCNGNTSGSGGTAFVNDYFYFRWTAIPDPLDVQRGIGQINWNPTEGWNLLSVRRGDMKRLGALTAGKGWNTVRAIRCVVGQVTGGGTANTVTIEGFTVNAGAVTTGEALYKYLYVRNDSTNGAFAYSAPSAASVGTSLLAQGATVTVPVDAGADAQINEIWLYRFDEVLGDYYRVTVKTGVVAPIAAPIAITDSLSDAQALVVDLVLQGVTGTAQTPPDTIVGIEAPYFDRLFALTARNLYPSQKLSPDTFLSTRVLKVAGVDETAYWVKKSLGGLYVGTSKDIYRLDGDGAELPDGTLNFSIKPTNNDHPPISAALAHDGDVVIYLASDGWREMSGTGSTLLVGPTSLLYKGYTRHGISPVNLATGRLRATVCGSQLIAMTPEGASAANTPTLYRKAPQRGADVWYRHVYPYAIRTVYAEPDGTLLVGDASGNVSILDAGVDDTGATIPIVFWTPVDPNGQLFQRKDPWDITVHADTGNINTVVNVHLDNSGTLAQTVNVQLNGPGVASVSIGALATFTQVQLRVTCAATTTWRWYDFGIQYRERPMLTYFAEPKPNLPSLSRRRFGGIQIAVDTLGAAATVTPILDGAAQTPISVTTADSLAKTLTFTNVVGRDLWARITKTTGFELYTLEPLIQETLPPVTFGRLAPTNVGYAGEKVFAGIKLKLCTLNVARTITVYFDGVAFGTTYAFTSGATEPITALIQFAAAQTATDIAIGSDGDIELYEMEPLVLYQLPTRIKAWENKPLVASPVRRRFNGLTLQINTHGANATMTPVVDGVDGTPVTVATSEWLGKTVTFTDVVGRDLWCRVTSATAFNIADVQPIIVETLPALVFGRLPASNYGWAGDKVLKAIKIKACTLNAARTFTVYLDGAAFATTYAFTTGADEAVTNLIQFAAVQTATDIAIGVDGNIELYEIEPLVVYQLPPRVKAWEHKPLVASNVRRRFSGFTLQIHTHAAAATVTPVLDGVDQSTLSVTTSEWLNKTLTFTDVIGKDLWCRITCSTAFNVSDVQPIVVETMPLLFKGRIPYSNSGYAGEKVITGLKVKFCSLGAAATITPIVDGVNQTASIFTTDANEPTTEILTFTAGVVTGTDIAFSVNTNIELYEWEPLILYQLPVKVKVWENKPLVASPVRRRFGGFTLQVNAHGDTIGVIPYLDGVAQAQLTVTDNDLLGKTLTFASLVGRDLWPRLSSVTAFSVEDVQPIVLDTLPAQFKGLTPTNTTGAPNIKTASGVQVRVCTLAATVTITPYLDGLPYTAGAVSVTTGLDDPQEVTLPFPVAQEYTTIALSFSGNVELYDWHGLVTAQRPLGVKAWDSGPIDLGTHDLVWLREVRLKVRAWADLVVTPWFDGVPFTAVTVPIAPAGTDTVVTIPVGRTYVGRQPRLVVTSTAAFYPYWVECTRRESGRGSQKPHVRVPVALGGAP